MRLSSWSVLLVLWLTYPAQAKVGFGVRSWLTEPGHRAVQNANGYFDLDMAAGSTVQHQVELENTGDEPLKLDVYPGDGANSSSGSLTGTGLGETPHASGLWVSLERTMVPLKPREMQRVNFKLSVPIGTPQGDYFAWVFVEPQDQLISPSPASPTPTATNDTQFALKIKKRLGVVLLIHVGDRTKFTRHIGIDDGSGAPPEAVAGGVKTARLGKYFRDGQIYYGLKLDNRGETYLKPRWQWRLLDAEGKLVSGSPEATDLGYLCAGHPLVITVPLTAGKILPRGHYSLEITVQDPRYADIHLQNVFNIVLP